MNEIKAPNILDHGKDGVLIIDQNKRVTYINESGMEIIKAQKSI